MCQMKIRKWDMLEAQNVAKETRPGGISSRWLRWNITRTIWLPNPKSDVKTVKTSKLNALNRQLTTPPFFSHPECAGRRALEHSCMSGSFHSVIGDLFARERDARFDWPHFISNATVDGRNPAQLERTNHLQSFKHLKWCRVLHI